MAISIRIFYKAFCSRYNTKHNYISVLQLDFSSFRNMNKCMLKQLSGLTTTNHTRIEIEGMENSTNRICSCTFREFASRFRIQLHGNCIWFKESKCRKNRKTWKDECDKSPFSCQSSIGPNPGKKVSTSTEKNILKQTVNSQNGSNVKIVNSRTYVIVYLLVLLLDSNFLNSAIYSKLLCVFLLEI
jgi:hypothetical protein